MVPRVPPTMIAVVFGNRACKVEIFTFGRCCDTDVQDGLGFEESQRTHLSLISLKPDSAQLKEGFFRQDSYFDIPASELEAGATYTLTVQDKRKRFINRLRDEEKKELRQDFDRLDSNGDGQVTMEDLSRYYEEKTSQRIELARRTSTAPTTWRTISRGIRESSKIQLRSLRQQDLDKDGCINFEEFLNYNAHRLHMERRREKNAEKEKKQHIRTRMPPKGTRKASLGSKDENRTNHPRRSTMTHIDTSITPLSSSTNSSKSSSLPTIPSRNPVTTCNLLSKIPVNTPKKQFSGLLAPKLPGICAGCQENKLMSSHSSPAVSTIQQSHFTKSEHISKSRPAEKKSSISTERNSTVHRRLQH